MYCATHPEVETNLECGRCGKPICPRCMVQTPVGARCRECARLRRLPIYEVSPAHYLKAAGAGLGLALLIGVAWWVLRGLVPFLYLDLLLAAAAGYALGEGVSLSVNRKRGPGLQAIAGVAVAISYLMATGLYWGLWGLAALALGIVVAVSRLR